MRCIRIDDYGGPEVLRRRELPVPSPGPGEVLVRVRHAGINFMDVHTRQGKYASSRTYPVRLPCTLGMEGAGEVVDAGPGAGPWQVGARVAWCLSWGSYAEFAVVPCERLVRVPEALPLEMAAAALFHGCTAHYLAHDVGRLGPGSSCLVHAASGGIGQLLVQMARRVSARVFATISSEAKRDAVRALGADEVFPYDAGRFRRRVRRSARRLSEGAARVAPHAGRRRGGPRGPRGPHAGRQAAARPALRDFPRPQASPRASSAARRGGRGCARRAAWRADTPGAG
ncbi:MAG TPA: alcohol dehydrogenase catalytic domain-containing protein [Zeimonas sp.]|nr:alcohol dehydrogenase catalytic domain-containing protein [Zeimonas sp.]